MPIIIFKKSFNLFVSLQGTIRIGANPIEVDVKTTINMRSKLHCWDAMCFRIFSLIYVERKCKQIEAKMLKS